MSTDKNIGIWATPVISPAILTFNDLLTPIKYGERQGKPKGEPKYSATLMLEPDSEALTSAKAKLKEVALAKWPGVDLATIAFPLKSGNKRIAKAKAEGKRENDFEAGMVVVIPTSQKPIVMTILDDGLLNPLDAQSVKEGMLDLQSAEQKKRYIDRFFAGCKVLVGLNFVAYDPVGDGGKRGVAVYINNILSLNKGERLFGGRSGAEVFKGVAGHLSQEDPIGDEALEDTDIPI